MAEDPERMASAVRRRKCCREVAHLVDYAEHGFVRCGKSDSDSVFRLHFLSFATFLLLLRLDRQPVAHRDYDHGKRRSRVIRYLWKQAAELVPTEHRVLVIRSEHHQVRMPVADPRSEVLIRRPHVRERNSLSFRQLSFGIS